MGYFDIWVSKLGVSDSHHHILCIHSYINPIDIWQFVSNHHVELDDLAFLTTDAAKAHIENPLILELFFQIERRLSEKLVNSFHH